MKKPISKNTSKVSTKSPKKTEKMHPLDRMAQILEPYKGIIKPYGEANF